MISTEGVKVFVKVSSSILGRTNFKKSKFSKLRLLVPGVNFVELVRKIQVLDQVIVEDVI